MTALRTLREITLSTNGQMLHGLANPLATVGLIRVNVSLDTAHDGRFLQAKRGGEVMHTFRGIEGAVRAGLTPVRTRIDAPLSLTDGEFADNAV